MMSRRHIWWWLCSCWDRPFHSRVSWRTFVHRQRQQSTREWSSRSQRRMASCREANSSRGCIQHRCNCSCLEFQPRLLCRYLLLKYKRRHILHTAELAQKLSMLFLDFRTFCYLPKKLLNRTLASSDKADFQIGKWHVDWYCELTSILQCRNPVQFSLKSHQLCISTDAVIPGLCPFHCIGISRVVVVFSIDCAQDKLRTHFRAF